MSDCIFCKIAAGEIPTDKVLDEDDLIVFRDINAQAPTHLLVIPRQHIATMNDVTEADEAVLGRLLGAQSAKLDGCEGERDEIVVRHRLADLPVRPLEFPETVQGQCMFIPKALWRFERFQGR